MTVEGAGYIVIGLVAGIVIMIYGLYLRARVRASRDWPQTMGAILKAEVVEETDNDSVEYRVRVEYEYSVDGQRRIGRRIEFGKSAYARKKNAQAQLERYPVGTSVMVFFDPEKPEDAVLLRKSSWGTMYIVLGLAFAIFSIAIFFFASART